MIADSNVLMPPDYIQRLLARWRADTGIVCAPPIGSRAQSFAAEIECAFLNTYQARWQYSAEALGFGFAQGKTMLWRRDVLEAGGGIEALGRRDRRGRRLDQARPSRRACAPISSTAPFAAAAGRAALARRLGAAGALGAAEARDFPALFRARACHDEPADARRGGDRRRWIGLTAPAALTLAAAIWYGAEAGLAAAAGWPLAWSSLLAWIARDLALPGLWSVAG